MPVRKTVKPVKKTPRRRPGLFYVLRRHGTPHDGERVTGAVFYFSDSATIAALTAGDEPLVRRVPTARATRAS